MPVKGKFVYKNSEMCTTLCSYSRATLRWTTTPGDHCLITLLLSISCVIAELFSEGSRLFDLSELLEYRNGKYDPSEALSKIDNTDIRVSCHAICLSLLQIPPGMSRAIVGGGGGINLTVPGWSDISWPGMGRRHLHTMMPWFCSAGLNKNRVQ